MQGRKKDDKSAKITRGTYRPDRENTPKEVDLQTVRYLTKMPAIPTSLTEASARKLWATTGTFLKENRFLTDFMVTILEDYCLAHQELKLAESQLVDASSYVTYLPNGAMQTNPWVDIRNKAIARKINLAERLGITPNAQMKVKPINKKEEEEKNPFDVLMRKNG